MFTQQEAFILAQIELRRLQTLFGREEDNQLVWTNEVVETENAWIFCYTTLGCIKHNTVLLGNSAIRISKKTGGVVPSKNLADVLDEVLKKLLGEYFFI